MSRNDQSLFEDIIDISSRLPPWACSILAIHSFFIFHQYANSPPPLVSNPSSLFDAVPGMFFKGLSLFLQFILPAGFLIGAVASLITRGSKYGFISAGKSLAFALFVSFISLLIANLILQPPFPASLSNSEFYQRLSDLSPFHKKSDPQTEETGKSNLHADGRAFTKEEIASAKEKTINDRVNSTTYEIRLNSGRSMFAKRVTVNGNTVSIENEGGSLVTLDKQDVMKITKLVSN